MNKALVTDLARKRREYLAKKTIGNFGAIAGICILAISVLGLLAAVGTFSAGSTLATFAVSVLLVTSLLGYSVFDFSVEKVAKLPHVPPVIEQIAALSAEEVLLRASDQPAAAPEELLRAAHTAKVDSAQELLRAGRAAE